MYNSRNLLSSFGLGCLELALLRPSCRITGRWAVFHRMSLLWLSFLGSSSTFYLLWSLWTWSSYSLSQWTLGYASKASGFLFKFSCPAWQDGACPQAKKAIKKQEMHQTSFLPKHQLPLLSFWFLSSALNSCEVYFVQFIIVFCKELVWNGLVLPSQEP